MREPVTETARRGSLGQAATIPVARRCEDGAAVAARDAEPCPCCGSAHRGVRRATGTSPARPSNQAMGKSMSAADHLRLMTSDRAELEPLLTAREVAHILGVRDKRVYELGIPAVRLSERSLRWRPSDVQRWIEERSRM